MEKRVAKEPKVSKSNKYFEIYLEYVRMYSVLQLKWTIQRGYSTEIKNIWLDMTRKLNGCGGPVRDVTHWKKVFTEWKSHTRKKLKCNKPLNDLEKQLVELTGLTANPERPKKHLNKKEGNIVIKREILDEASEDTDSGFVEQEISTGSVAVNKSKSTIHQPNGTIASKENNVQQNMPLPIQRLGVLDASTQVNQTMLDTSNIIGLANIGVALQNLATAINRYHDVMMAKRF